MVACFEVDTNNGVRVEAEINSQNFETHIIVVHFVVAECNINVDGVEIFVFYQELLVDFGSLFEVTAEVVKGGHAELIFNRGAESAVKVHNLVLIAEFLSQLKQESVFERGVCHALFGFHL